MPARQRASSEKARRLRRLRRDDNASVNQFPALWYAHERAPRLAKFFQSIWKLKLPFERRVPLTGSRAWFLRAYRLAWVLLTMPFLLAVLSMSFVLDFVVQEVAVYPVIQALAMILHVILPRRQSWTFMTSFLILLTQRMLWAFTFGIPLWRAKKGNNSSQSGREQESQLPFLNFSGWLYSWLSDYIDTWHTNSPSHYSSRKGETCRLAFKDISVPPLDQKQLRLLGASTGGCTASKPVAISCTWIWINDKLRKFDVDALEIGSRRKERVILYLVGGGFISGSALKFPFAKPLLRCLNAENDLSWRDSRDGSPDSSACADTIPMITAEYRKSLSSDTGFPAALEDVIAVWQYLTVRCRYRPENIIICGDSSGANLCIVLSLWLAHQGGQTPGLVCLLSPWVDLTLSHPSVGRNSYFDILSTEMLENASDMYIGTRRATSATHRTGKSVQQLGAGKSQTLHDSMKSKAQNPAAHAYVSPALKTDSHTDAFKTLGTSTRDHYSSYQLPMRIFIAWGTAEMLDNEIRTLIDNLEVAAETSEGALQLVLQPCKDMVHCYAMCLPPAFSKGSARMYGTIRKLLR